MMCLVVVSERMDNIYILHTNLLNGESYLSFLDSYIFAYLHHNSQDIKFVDKNKELLGLLISQNPIIKTRLQELQDYLEVEMPNHMNHVESSANSDKPFTTIHFDYYFRFGEKVSYLSLLV